MKITEKEKKFLPQVWHTYSRLADIAKTTNKDLDDLVYSLWFDLKAFDDKEIARIWPIDIEPAFLYDLLVSEGILTIECGEELSFRLTEYGQFFRESIDKIGQRRQQHYEESRKKAREKESIKQAVVVSVFVVLILCLLSGLFGALTTHWFNF